ncbi:MAG TPA: hypothetical protein DCM28_05020 [Phycisphaerales bacterium]|nr:hypothetical protein [Phycisphaerales bacterium]HCD32599.1 hypothetical protein [Phycisphaerales bacterium]|tara:strand:+ start:1297 stop:2973 length:1677 start_codon:yes stop_codon:yes gene_type:complete
MTTDMYDENLILGYIEDELTAEQKASFEQTLKTDARLAALVSSMQQDRAVLSDLDQVTAPMELGDYVSTQLERQMLLGPLPKRRKASPTNYSTPQSRSHSRMMRIWAYGSLAAMFMVIVGLMYQHIGSQSLIERTKQMVFHSDSEQGPTVVLREDKEFDSTIDDLLKLPPAPIVNETTPATASAKIAKNKQSSDAYLAKTKKLEGMIANDADLSPKDEAASSNALAIPQPTNVPMIALSKPMPEEEKSQNANKPMTMALRSRGNASASEPAPASAPAPPTVESLVAMDQPAKVTADSALLKELSPTTAKLAAEQPAATSPTTPLATGGAMSWSDRDADDSSQLGLGEKSEVAIALRPVAPTAAPAARQSMMSAPTQLGDVRTGNDVSSKLRVDKPVPQLGTIVTENQLGRVQLQQQQPVCVIEARRPAEAVQQITDWAISNRVQIVTPATTEQNAKKSNDTPKDQLDQSNTQPLRQVITLDLQANQVPVLVHWLNSQSSQLNNWIAPLPQTHTANESYQRLQQELPLAPTIPLIKPQDTMQIQLMVVPDTRPQPADKK